MVDLSNTTVFSPREFLSSLLLPVLCGVITVLVFITTEAIKDGDVFLSLWFPFFIVLGFVWLMYKTYVEVIKVSEWNPIIMIVIGVVVGMSIGWKSETVRTGPLGTPDNEEVLLTYTPTEWVNPAFITEGPITAHMPPGPARQAHVPMELRAAISDGKFVFSAHDSIEERHICNTQSNNVCLDADLVAVNGTSGEQQRVTVREQQDGSHDINPLGYTVRRESRWNGANTEFDVEAPPGWSVLALQRVIYPANVPTAVIYAPYSDELDTPELREAGLRRVMSMVNLGFSELEVAGVLSEAFRHENPRPLVTDFVSRELAVSIILTEKVGGAEFEACVEDNECKLARLNRALTLIGANGKGAFAHAVSDVSAAGWAQIWSKTYGGLRDNYPGANLPASFRVGAANHLTATKAEIVHFDSEFQGIRNKTWRAAIRDDPELRLYFGAAGYNGSASRIARAMVNNGADWRDHLCTTRSCETRTYVEIFEFVYNTLFGEGLAPPQLENVAGSTDHVDSSG